MTEHNPDDYEIFQPPDGPIDDAGNRPPQFSDEALALRFAERHADNMRYVATLGRWFRWDGRRWQIDDTLRVFDLARATCREAAARCDKVRTQSVASAKTVSAVERLARADRRLAGTSDQWDADPWLLNTPGGLIDMRTGVIRAPDRAAFCTKITAVAPEGDCPVFRKFLARITNDDPDLMAYLQRLAGYGCTGSTREHAMAFGYGAGANGKSTLIDILSHCLGDYAVVAPIETFTASAGDRHPTELAMLRGARLVTSTETEVGRRWAESRIKALTGGDRLSARYMRQDFFSFVPQFTLFIAGNHRPGLRGVDEAIRRRLHLIPFNVTIPTEERVSELAERLRTEAGGILAWMLDGVSDWLEHGLSPPATVRQATDAYLENEDLLGAWLTERCEQFIDAWAPVSVLYDDYHRFAKAAGERLPQRKNIFSSELEKRGFIGRRKKHARGYLGLRLATDQDDLVEGG